MAFVHGKSTRVLLNGYDMTSYFREANPSARADVSNITPFGKTAKEYMAGLRDATLSLGGFYDGSADAIDEILKAVLAGQVIGTVLPEGDAVGKQGYALDALESSYDIDSPVEDACKISAELQSKVGLDAVVSLHALSAETGTGNGTAVDGAAATANGGAAYLQVSAIAGAAPSVTFTIEDSADGATGWATIGTFTVVTAARSKERIAIAGTIRRYTRVVRTFGGTTTSITFHASIARL